MFVKRLGNTAPADILGQYFLILRIGRTVFLFQGLQGADSPDIVFKPGFLTALAQMIVCDTEVQGAFWGNLLFLLHGRIPCNWLFRQRLCSERKVPGIPIQQWAKNSFAFGPVDGIGHRRITEGDVVETHAVHREGTVIHIDGVAGMQIVCERRLNGRLRLRMQGRRQFIVQFGMLVRDIRYRWRIGHSRIRHRKAGIRIDTLHFIKLRLLRFCKISAGFCHAADMLFHCRPAELHFLRKAPL